MSTNQSAPYLQILLDLRALDQKVNHVSLSDVVDVWTGEARIGETFTDVDVGQSWDSDGLIVGLKKPLEVFIYQHVGMTEKVEVKDISMIRDDFIPNDMRDLPHGLDRKSVV